MTAPQRLRDVVRAAPLTCGRGTVVRDVAASMATDPARAVVVLDDGGAPTGIVTDRDFRAKVVAGGRDPSLTTAGDVMTSPLVTIPASARPFEALVEMTHREIHHLVVLDDGKLLGVVSSDDVISLPAAHPVHLARAIKRADTLTMLADLAARVTGLVRALVEQDRRAPDIARIVAELNDRLVCRVLALSEATVTARLGTSAPGAYCWLVFGSEGRREQTLRTDQDNGLVYEDASDAPRASWFQALAREAIDGLVSVGFPLCPGGAMASNPAWCQPAAVWEGYFRGWMESPTPEHILAGAMYFDARPLAGALTLGARLTALLRAEAPQRRHFLSALARDVVDRPLPLTLLGAIRRGPIDVKAAGAMHLVGAARVHALALGLAETSTVDRVLGAGAAGVYTGGEATEIVDAFEHLLQLRLVGQLARLAEGQPPDNRIDPRRLSRRDAVLLRSAFDTVAQVQAGLRDRYRTDLMA